jgi:O-antigen ligase
MSQKAYKYLLQGGIYLSLLVVFFVFKNLLFPYITSKQISFNIIMEILGVFWIALLVKYPVWRPKKNYITLGLIVFFAVLTVSAIFGVDFNLSFWGDIERMLGVFHLLHFLLFYLIIITVFKEWNDWKIFFIISLLFSIFVSINTFSGSGFATIGNTLYVAGYIIFNLAFSLLLFSREKNKIFGILYLLPIPLLLYAFDNVSSAGGYVGIVAGILLALFLYGLLNKNKTVKIATISSFIMVFAFISYVFVFQRDNYLTRNVAFIRNIKDDASFQKNTFQTRLLSWKAAYKDFKNHPSLGTGHGNYAITFDKYFDPKFYSYTSSETYFDRAHNNLIDIASTSGSLGLLAYLLIFAAAVYYWIKAYLQEKIGIHEFIIVSALVTAYFIQNLGVFDSLVTYMGLMMTLAYIYWNYHKDEDDGLIYKAQGSSRSILRSNDRPLNNPEIYAFAVAGIVFLTILYQYNFKVLAMLKNTIDGQIAYAQTGIKTATDVYRQALSYNTPLDRDSRNSYIRLVISDPDALKKLKAETAQDIIDYAIALNEKNLAYNPADSLAQMTAAQTYMTAGTYYAGNQEKSVYYINLALEAINKSIAASPGRPPIYYQKAQILISMGDKSEATKVLKYAVSLNEDYPDSVCNLSRALFYFKEDAEAYRNMDICLDKNGAGVLNPAQLIKALVNHYLENNDLERSAKLFARLTELESSSSENWIKLATIYKKIGDSQVDEAAKMAWYAQADTAAGKAGELDPAVKQAADDFIQSLGLPSAEMK